MGIILPAAKALGYALPSECPLAPELDRFLPQERAKTQLRSGHWKCEFCSKVWRQPWVFLSQPYLDSHMDARHADMLPPPHRSTCLADYADLLHARRFEAWAARQAGWASDPMPCNRAAAARRQQECAELAERCFPRGAGKQARALNDLLGSLCKAHTCDVRRKRRLLQAAAEGRQRWRAGWTALAVAVVLVVALFYWLLLAVTRGPRGRKAHTT
eukprot:scaffold6.g2683.t1